MVLLLMGWDYVSELLSPTGPIVHPADDMSMESHGGMIGIHLYLRTRRKSLSRCHFGHDKSHMEWPQARTRASAVSGQLQELHCNGLNERIRGTGEDRWRMPFWTTEILYFRVQRIYLNSSFRNTRTSYTPIHPSKSPSIIPFTQQFIHYIIPRASIQTARQRKGERRVKESHANILFYYQQPSQDSMLKQPHNTAMGAEEWRGGIAPTYSRPRHYMGVSRTAG
jgi:hypothetical protein